MSEDISWNTLPFTFHTQNINLKPKKEKKNVQPPPINIDHQSLNFKHMKSSYALTKVVKHSEHVLQQNMELMRVFILMLIADNNINSDKLLLIGRS